MTMSNHNLFIHHADGASEPATTEQILAAARQGLGVQSASKVPFSNTDLSVVRCMLVWACI
jgi:hypothetical protein